MNWDMGNNLPLDRLRQCRLSHQSIRDLQFWRRLLVPEVEDRRILPFQPDATLHTDAADVLYGDIFNRKNLQAGSASMWCDQEILN